MNPLIVQQLVLDNTLVALEDRIEIGKYNMRIDPNKTQKETTYQVVPDTLKLSPCYNAFTIIAYVPEIYMHQFWFTISKIKDSSSYKLKLDNKTFKIGVEIFREILQMCPKIPNQRFDESPSHEEIVTIIKEIGYKGDLKSITKMLTDHIAKRHAGMPYPKFTKAIIQHFISKDKTISMRNKLFMHTIKDDSVMRGLKFVSKHEDSQVYDKTIPNAMVSREIMETTAYKTYFAFSTGKAILKKVRKRTKIATTPKKKSYLMANDNIISEDPNALELAKSISRTEAEEQEATRLVHETHVRLVTKKSTGTRKQTSVVFKDTPTVSKKKPLDQSQKLKGVQVMSVEERLAPTVGTRAHDDSKDSWGTKSDIKKSDKQNIKEGDVPWIYSDDDEEDDNDDDQSIDIEETDDDEPTKSDNEDQAMDDAKKNDEDKESADAEITSLVDVQIQQEIPSVLLAPLLDLRVSDLEKEVKELKQVNLSTTLLASTRSEVPSVVNENLGSSLGDALQFELQKHTKELRQEYSQKSTSEIQNFKMEHAEKQQKSQYTIKSSDKTALAEFDQKQVMFDSMHESKSLIKHPANKTLYHALMESLIADEYAMDQGVADLIKHKKRPHDDDDRDQDPPAGPD
nr:hypothetical protein [Tanacetum cinerariifolium]